MEATMDNNIASARLIQDNQNAPFESDVKDYLFNNNNMELRNYQEFIGPKINFDHEL